VSRYPLPPVWMIPLWAGLVHCAEPLRAPSAFSEERYLCDSGVFDAYVDECHADYLRGGTCHGWVSFRGTIDTQRVVVDSPATRIIPAGPRLPDGRPSSGMQVYGTAPYFDFRLSIIDPEKPGDGSVGPEEVSGVAMNTTVDYINVEARGGNYLASWINETRQLQILTADEVRFTFVADLLRGGHIEGCLDVFLGNKL
jgi:hypothetical protein